MRKPLLLFALAALTSSVQAAVSLETENSAAILPADITGPSEKAMEAFRNGNHNQAVELAKPLAEKGDAQALYLLGFASETGKGMPASRDEALKYYRKSADLKYTDAAYRSALILLSSTDKKEQAEAKKILETAAQTDPTVAGRILGEAYLRGRVDGKENAKEAIGWWTRAADAGDIPSIVLLARLYEGQFGQPDVQDAKKAMQMYAKAAGMGHAPAMAAYGSRLLSGDKALRDEAKGREWLEKAIDNKEVSGFLVLGDYEENTKKDLKKALNYYERGKDAGQIDCILRSADFYLNGKGVDKDEDRAITLLEQAAKAGNPIANYQIAAHVLNAKKPDLLKGYGYLLAAANGQLSEAQNELGLLYLSGKLGVADGPAATSWFTRAAQSGNALAQYNLGMLYLSGSAGLPQNLINAADLFSRAANQGHGGSMLALANMLNQGAGLEKDTQRAWVLATLATEKGVEDAEKLVITTAKNLTEAQRKEGRKLLGDMKSGKEPIAPAKQPK